jgi:hypothetical protein
MVEPSSDVRANDDVVGLQDRQTVRRSPDRHLTGAGEA